MEEAVARNVEPALAAAGPVGRVRDVHEPVGGADLPHTGIDPTLEPVWWVQVCDGVGLTLIRVYATAQSMCACLCTTPREVV